MELGHIAWDIFRGVSEVSYTAGIQEGRRRRRWTSDQKLGMLSLGSHLTERSFMESRKSKCKPGLRSHYKGIFIK